VALAADTVLQPDLLVGRRDDFTTRDLPVAPVLAIEVLSPSSRAYDLLLKKDRLERAGCQHYWVIDPDVPAITAWTLHDGVYREVASVSGNDPLTVSDPYPITLVPTAVVTD
jgi:Uma2 family endonuclease